MKIGQTGTQSYIVHYGHTGQHTKQASKQPHSDWHSGPGEIERKGVGKDSVGDIVQARGTPNSYPVIVRVGAKTTKSIRGQA